MKSTSRRFVRSESGQEIIEFALASVVFLMTVFGMLEFGLAVWHYNMVANLAQEGARWASVHGSSSAAPASTAAVQTVRGRSPGVTVTVTTLPTPSTLAPGQAVSVEVRTTFAPLTSLIPLGSLTLQSTAQMIVAR